MQILNDNELEQAFGGIGPLAFLAGVGTAIAIYDGVSEFIEGFKEGYKDAS